jgi:hypothetical protein
LRAAASAETDLTDDQDFDVKKASSGTSVGRILGPVQFIGKNARPAPLCSYLIEPRESAEDRADAAMKI